MQKELLNGNGVRSRYIFCVSGCFIATDREKVFSIKNGKKPTREQRKLIQQRRLDPAVWLVIKDTPEEMVLVHRYSDKTTKVIRK